MLISYIQSSLANAPELISEIAKFWQTAVVGCVDYQHINGARSVLIETVKFLLVSQCKR